MEKLILILKRAKLSLRLAGLGVSVVDKFKLFILPFWYPLRKKFGFTKDLTVALSVRKFDRKCRIFLTGWVDISILSGIFLDEEYAFDLKEEPKIIFDLGSNVGFSILYFHLKYPNAKIYGFEADPGTFQKLEKNIEGKKSIEIFPYAVSDVNGNVKFYSYPERNAHSSLVARENADDHLVEVEAKTLDTLIEEIGTKQIDILKFDIEGGEEKVFKNFQNFQKISFLVGELHLDLISETKDEFLQTFKELFEIQLRPVPHLKERFDLFGKRIK